MSGDRPGGVETDDPKAVNRGDSDVTSGDESDATNDTNPDAANPDDSASDVSDPDSPLARIRTEPRIHVGSLAPAAAAGVAIASVHWIGLVAAGAAVAVVAPTLRRGALYAAGVGALSLIVFTVSLGSAAALVPGMRPVVYVTVASAFGLPLFGSLARGLV